MIYAIRITIEGKKVLDSDKAYDGTFSIRRLVILSSSKSDKWRSWTEVYKFIERARKKFEVENPSLSKQLVCDPNKVFDDMRWLESFNYIDIARYKTITGEFLKDKPLGMVFHDGSRR